MNGDKIVILDSYTTITDANISRGVLEEHGVDCFLSNENFSILNPHFNIASGGIKLHVFEKDVSRAKEILKSTFDSESEIIELQTESEIKVPVICPKCNSANVRYGPSAENKFPKASWVIAFLFLIFPFPKNNYYHCFECGNEFLLK
ncbi:MAG: putative signal transducing protein [Chitinophagales bacterium]